MNELRISQLPPLNLFLNLPLISSLSSSDMAVHSALLSAFLASLSSGVMAFHASLLACLAAFNAAFLAFLSAIISSCSSSERASNSAFLSALLAFFLFFQSVFFFLSHVGIFSTTTSEDSSVTFIFKFGKVIRVFRV